MLFFPRQILLLQENPEIGTNMSLHFICRCIGICSVIGGKKSFAFFALGHLLLLMSFLRGINSSTRRLRNEFIQVCARCSRKGFYKYGKKEITMTNHVSRLKRLNLCPSLFWQQLLFSRKKQGKDLDSFHGIEVVDQFLFRKQTYCSITKSFAMHPVSLTLNCEIAFFSH